MARWAYTIAALAALAAWAGAQGPRPPAPLDAADRLRLLKANSTLIDNLVDHGVELSRADAVEARAEQCRRAAKALASAIQDAAARHEAERVAELSGLFREVVRDALLPTLEHGRQTVPAESPAGRQLQAVRDGSARDLSELRAALPATGKVGDSARVKDAVRELDQLGEKLK
jgi:hypothetical protein